MEAQDRCEDIKMAFVEKACEEASFSAISLNCYICEVLIGCVSRGYMTSSHKYCVYIKHLTLCVPCIILQCVNKQRDAQFL